MSLYSKSDLEKIAKESGFIRDNLEKVIRLNDILIYFNTNPRLAENLVLKGGTAINLTVFDMPRLSVDIDLDLNKECSRDDMLAIRESINKEILDYMFTQGYTLSPNTKNPHSLDSWAFYYQNAANNRDNIKIDINYSMRHHIYPVNIAQTKVEFLPSTEIRAVHPIELFGSKIKALIERTAARDLYDVYNMISNSVFAEVDLKMLRKSILFYLAIGGSYSPKLEYSFDAIDKLKFPQIRAHLIPVLRKSEQFDFEEAKRTVKEFLTSLVAFTDEEKRFIEEFNSNNYVPELLFDDKEIIQRIKLHPMAIWKTRKTN
ncbi:MAG: nucleotidyl transferase AbiEii/AbiGii toxin family protein [Phocaeicola sp.]